MSSLYAPISGLDNHSPIYTPDGRFQIWEMNEIYLGFAGEGKYVPKVNDLVVNVNGAVVKRYVVVSLDPVSFVPTLIEEDITKDTPDFTTDDILYGVGPGTQSETYRVYIDKSVTPFRLNVDRRLFVGGSSCQYCKLFLGVNTSEDGVVVSAFYDGNGALTTSNIPLELVRANTALKVVQSCFTNHQLINGEVLTAVFYDTDGFAVSKRQLLVEETGFIMSTESSKKYVSSIALETPFMSTINNKLIQYPMNVPINTMNLIGVITYSDGTKVKKVIDGVQLELFGLSSYISSVTGRTQLVLKYNLNDEEALDVHLGNANFISEIYDIETMISNNHYAVQLFCYPVWDLNTNNYALKWYLYDLDRNASYEVTNSVVVNTSKGAFNPTSYGAKQTLTVSINLANVNGSYNNFNHVQLVNIIINKPGTGRPNVDGISNWLVDSTADGGIVYGSNVYATYRVKSSTEWTIRLAPAFATQADWLTHVYRDTQPMFDDNLETSAPEPTHFQLFVNGVKTEYSINQWNTVITVNQQVASNSTIFVKFIKRTNTNDLHLGVSGMQVFQTDTSGIFI